MDDKPKHLQPEYALQFQDLSVVDAYGYRPPMPDEVVPRLLALIPAHPSAVLDIGCGQGELARSLARHVARVDGVDWSVGMIERGRNLPGGARANLSWIAGKAEEVSLTPPYALVTAGQSLHWMDWSVMLPRIGSMLSPGGVLAIVGWDLAPPPWHRQLRRLIEHWSTNQDYQPYDLIEELSRRRLFTEEGRRALASVPFRQSLAAYIESFHARNGLSRDRMTKEAAAAFDQGVRALGEPFVDDGQLSFTIVGEVVWGRPEVR